MVKYFGESGCLHTDMLIRFPNICIQTACVPQGITTFLSVIKCQLPTQIHKVFSNSHRPLKPVHSYSLKTVLQLTRIEMYMLPSNTSLILTGDN